MSSSLIQHQAMAQEKVATQYKESPNILAYLYNLIELHQELERVFCDIIEKRRLENATGSQLEVLGKLVGQEIQLGQSDEAYAAFIRARIVRNSTKSTREDMIAAVNFILGESIVEIVDGPVQVTVNIGRELTPEEEDLIQNSGLIPKTVGVQFDFTVFDPEGYYGFLDDPSIFAKGYSSLATPEVGGIYTRIV